MPGTESWKEKTFFCFCFANDDRSASNMRYQGEIFTRPSVEGRVL